MNKKQPQRLLREGRFTMHPPMKGNNPPPGSENWPRVDRTAEYMAAGPPVPGWVMAGEPVPPSTPPAGD